MAGAAYLDIVGHGDADFLIFCASLGCGNSRTQSMASSLYGCPGTQVICKQHSCAWTLLLATVSVCISGRGLLGDMYEEQCCGSWDCGPGDIAGLLCGILQGRLVETEPTLKHQLP